MYARSTTLTADPQRMDDGIAMVRDEVMPAVQGMPGCLGLSMLVDRDSGRCIVTTSWDSAEAMAATADRVMDMRRRAMDAMGGGDMSVEEWEVALMHRAHTAGDDACARVTWLRMDPAGMDSMLDRFRMTQMPQLEDMPGFCSVSILGDRRTGRCSLTSVWDDRGAMDASGERVAGLREEFAGGSGIEVTDVAEFQVTIHHLRVPEMA